MYTADDLDDLARMIIARGMQIEPDGIDHKHNEAVPGSPRAPLKLNLCTPALRAQGRMTEDDMDMIVGLWAQYIEHNHLKVPAIGCIPRVGEVYAERLQQYLFEQTGQSVQLVRAQKTVFPDQKRKITGVVFNEAYPSGDIWVLDDLVNWGHSEFEAWLCYTQAGYRVTDSLVAVDYGVNAGTLLGKLGTSLHSLISMESILELAAHKKLIEVSVIERTKAYLAASRLANTTLPNYLGQYVDRLA